MSARAEAALEDLARADAYAVLGRLLLAAPDDALLAALRAARREGDDDLTVAWNALCAAAAGDATDPIAEYAALFIGIGRPEVELHGSWYLTGFLMEKPLAELRDDLARLGLARVDGTTDTEDHVAALMETMRNMILSGAHGEARQARFFLRHIAPWRSGLCAALRASGAAVFYRGVAEFMGVFLDSEQSYFEVNGVSNP